MLEKEIERSILHYLDARGLFAFKINNVGIWDPVKKIYRKAQSKYIMKGVSDILCCAKVPCENCGHPVGRFTAIEVKTPKTRTRLTDHQRNFIDQVNRHHGIAFSATSVEEVEEHLGKRSLVY